MIQIATKKYSINENGINSVKGIRIRIFSGIRSKRAKLRSGTDAKFSVLCFYSRLSQWWIDIICAIKNMCDLNIEPSVHRTAVHRVYVSLLPIPHDAMLCYDIVCRVDICRSRFVHSISEHFHAPRSREMNVLHKLDGETSVGFFDVCLLSNHSEFSMHLFCLLWVNSSLLVVIVTILLATVCKPLSFK